MAHNSEYNIYDKNYVYNEHGLVLYNNEIDTNMQDYSENYNENNENQEYSENEYSENEDNNENCNNRENYTLISLPYEILSLIYDEHLSIKELLKLRFIDKELSDAINTEEFWRIMLKRDFPNTIGVGEEIDVEEIDKENKTLIRYIDGIINMNDREKYIYKYELYKKIEKVLYRDEKNTFTMNVYRAIELNNGIDRRLIKNSRHRKWCKEINIFDILPYITGNELSYDFTKDMVIMAYNTFWDVAKNNDTEKLLLSINNEMLTGVGLIGLQIYVYI